MAIKFEWVNNVYATTALCNSSSVKFDPHIANGVILIRQPLLSDYELYLDTISYTCCVSGGNFFADYNALLIVYPISNGSD